MNKKYSSKNDPLYITWSHMKSRCNDPNNKNYGGRGITYQDSWEKFKPFQKWALENGYKPYCGLSIERKDVNGNYTEDNCCWIPMKDQPKNTRKIRSITINNETKSLSEWARIIGISKSTLFERLKNNWTDEQLLLKALKR